MNIEAASPIHAAQAAPLIRLSGTKAFDYIFSHENGISNIQFLEKCFASEHTIFSHQHHYVVLKNNNVIGTFSLSTKKDHDRAFFSMASSIFKHYGLKGIIRGLLFEMRLVKPPKNKRLYLSHVTLDVPFRGKGYAGKIIEFADAVAQQKKIHTLALDVRADNENAIALYKRNGYKALKYSKSFTRFLDDHIYMEKTLAIEP